VLWQGDERDWVRAPELLGPSLQEQHGNGADREAAVQESRAVTWKSEAKDTRTGSDSAV